jgi:7,8-dihydroneopterin 2',3'-cyclic phosphate phosphodiesterase
MKMKNLIEIANLIEDKDLREKTIKLLKNIKITNKDFEKYEKDKTKIEEAFAGTNEFHHPYKGGLIDHTYAVTKICIEIANIFENVYKIKINRDYLISASLLHDIMKIFTFKKEGNTITQSNAKIDHGTWMCCELYARGFPEEIIHIVASHFGPNGPTAPQTTEALILFYADSLDSTIETFWRSLGLNHK